MSKGGVQLRVNVPGKGPEQSPSSQLGTRIPAQDYEKIRRHCLASNTLFEDPYFPANDSSLFYTQKLPFKPEWKRPREINSDPKFFTGGASRFDVSQGMLGDCWLVAAIASLTQDEILFNQVVPKQDFGRGYTGMFRFRFWHFGEWVNIVVDDRLPTYNGKLIFIHSTEADEFWSALFEKAYAKLYGGYEALKGGKTSEAMVDFTGGVVESFVLSEDNPELFQRIQRTIKHSSLMSCSIKAVTREDMEAKLDSGLVKGHAYSITGASTVKVKGRDVQLLRIRNPWGQKEWGGDWSDNSPRWREIPSSKRQELLEDGAKEDGEFWMSFEDVRKHFTDFEMCSVSIDQLYEDEAAKSWNSVVINGSWLTSAGTAGGCRNYPTFVKNPQYIVDLQEDSDGDGKCSCLVALMQKHRRKQKKMGVQDLCIGYSIYKVPDDGSDVVTKQWVDYHYSVGTSGSFTNAREVQKRFDCEPGRYIIIPCAFKPGEEGDFLLRIFTEKNAEARTEAVAKAGAPGEPAAEDPRRAQLKAMFSRLAGADGEIDSEELQDVLTASLSKDMSNSVFSLDACRSMISMLDVDKNGTLNYDEFQNLLETIGRWKKMFFKFDRDRSGTLERNEVSSAVRSLGYDVSQKAMGILFNRFAKKRKYMNLDDFAACLSRIKIMDDTFKRMSRGASTIHLSKDDFFQITLDA